MHSANRLIYKVAILLGVLWICFAVFIAVELTGHVIDRTSDARSQVLRTFSVVIFLDSAVSLFLRFPGWRWIVVIPCLLIGIRDYLYLMIPQELTWGYDQVIAAIRLGVTLVTIAMAVLWGRLASLSEGAVRQP